MKKTVLLITCLFIVLNTWSISFSDNGISFTITSANTVGVCRGSSLYVNDIVIPSNVSYLSTEYLVSSICDSAFFNCIGLTSITIPTSVTTIGNKAFYGCTGLASIPISNNVAIIGDYAFFNCIGLKNTSISNLNASVGAEAFYRCSGLLTASINAKIMGEGIFADCTSLTTVTIGNSLIGVGSDAFYNCSSLVSLNVDATNAYLTDIDGVLFSKDRTIVLVYPNAKGASYKIPDGVDSIASYAFETCYNLKSIDIPSSVTAIGESAFFGDSSLTSIILPPNLKYLNSWTFRGCTGLTSVIIPDSVKGMGRDVFMNCKSLASVKFSSSLSNIGAYAFSDCTGLTSVTIPPLVTSIGVVAFNNCSNLVQLNIPSSVTLIGSSAFASCLKLSTINAYGITPPVIYTRTFNGVNMSTCILNVPTGSKATYMANIDWKKFSNIVEKDMNVSVNELKQLGINLISGIGFIGVKLDQPSNISIYSVEGKGVYKEKLNVGFNLINLSNGIYLVKMNGLAAKVLVE